MSRYDQVWEDLVQGAVEQFDVSLRRLIRNARTLGMTEDAIEASLIDDINNEGPVFGPMLRSLSGAAVNTVLVAERQGEVMGRLRVLQNIAEIDGVVDDADPELMDLLEKNELDDEILQWVAALRNTCHRCLPLHGKRLARREWRERGLDPSTIHEGWNSACHCSLVPADVTDRNETLAPILRTAQKGQKRTARNLTQRDVEKALTKRDELLSSQEGRRMMRLLGTANQEEGSAE